MVRGCQAVQISDNHSLKYKPHLKEIALQLAVACAYHGAEICFVSSQRCSCGSRICLECKACSLDGMSEPYNQLIMGLASCIYCPGKHQEPHYHL